MQKFHDRTTQRFQEYDEKLQEKRQICKDKCDKEIQKIILKDKLEKELMDKFATLQTDIQNDAIPTCVCEKSLADKTEKFCLNCGVQLGGGVLQASGLLGGIGSVAVNGWKTEAIAAAIAAAEKTGAAAGLKAGDAAGMNVVIYYLKDWGIEQYCPDIFKSILKISHYSKVKDFAGDIVAKKAQICALTSSDENSMCLKFEIALRLRDAYGTPIAAPGKDPIVQLLNGLAEEAKLTADDVTKTISEKVTKAAIETSTGAIDAASTHLYSTIAYSITAILIIVLIMVIIYLILHYRRKKKMKKKAQYTKLLNE
ncbi:hypothetical protein PFMC_04199 [Plasmodium falciparum CAMP/Malaysia]|uniref:Rifin n=1 Tax=Plasmodium falciparum (isolate Camp / Malaysia) TaxID=5835 RepID=A0A024X355_PLAFC|nr:hypothetical protein PFMC_04199 [Plasmodium falciparum CAMP/Malaysia]